MRHRRISNRTRMLQSRSTESILASEFESWKELVRTEWMVENAPVVPVWRQPHDSSPERVRWSTGTSLTQFASPIHRNWKMGSGRPWMKHRAFLQYNHTTPHPFAVPGGSKKFRYVANYRRSRRVRSNIYRLVVLYTIESHKNKNQQPANTKHFAKLPNKITKHRYECPSVHWKWECKASSCDME